MTSITLSQAFPVMQETLQAGGTIRYYPKGISMLPMLRQEKDSVLLVQPTTRLKAGDIPLFRRNDGHFVLHRIVKVRKHDYIVCGDNQTRLEKGICDEQIIAVVDGFYREDLFISANHQDYQIYVQKMVKEKYNKRTIIKNIFQKLVHYGKRVLHEKA